VLASTVRGASDDQDLTTLKRLPAAVSIWVGGAEAGALRRAIDPRARLVPSLANLNALLNRHVG
jgi:hypothetical protein